MQNIPKIGLNYDLLYKRYRWNTRIFPFTKKSYLHRAQWRYYFYLLRVRILVSPWLLTWLANYKRASRSGARPVLSKFHSQNSFEVRRQYSYQWLFRWAAKFSHRYFFQAWRTFRTICRKKKSCVLCRNFISIYKINRTLHGRLGIRILSSRAESISHSFASLTRERYFQHSKIKFVSPRGHVISSIFNYSPKPKQFVFSLLPLN